MCLSWKYLYQLYQEFKGFDTYQKRRLYSNMIIALEMYEKMTALI